MKAKNACIRISFQPQPGSVEDVSHDVEPRGDAGAGGRARDIRSGPYGQAPSAGIAEEEAGRYRRAGKTFKRATARKPTF